MQSATPERRGATPTRTDVVGHVQLVLDHVGVRPDLLVGIRRQGILTLEEPVRVTQLVGTRGPRRTVAVGATQLREQFLATKHLRVVHVTCSGHSQTAVPGHHSGKLVIGHLSRQRLAGQVVVDIGLHVVRPPFGVLVVRVHLGDIGGKTGLYLGVFGRILGVDSTVHVQVMRTAVGTGHVGDVPDSVRTGTVLQRSAGEGVRETFGSPLRVVLVVTGLLECTVIERGIQAVLQFAVSRFLFVLRDDIGVGNSIQQARTVHTDGVLQQHFVALRLQQAVRVTVALVVHIHRRVGHGHLRINQFVGLTVGKLVAVFVHSRKPFQRDLAGVQRSLERCGAEQLRHTGQPGHIRVGGRVEHYQQRTVADVLGVVTGLAHQGRTVRVVGVAVLARGAHIHRTQTVLTARMRGDVRFLRQLVTLRKRHTHTCVFSGRSGLTETVGCQRGSRTQFASGVIPVGLLRGFGLGRITPHKRNTCQRKNQIVCFFHIMNCLVVCLILPTAAALRRRGFPPVRSLCR